MTHQDVFASIPPLNKYTPIDWEQVKSLYTPERQAKVQTWEEAISPQTLQSFFASGKMGVMEECADILFEYYTLQALQRHILDKQLVVTLHDDILVPVLSQSGRDTEVRFEDVLQQIDNRLGEARHRRFQKVTGLDAQAAHTLLSLAAFKFAIFHGRKPHQDMEGLTKAFVKSEADEFRDEIPSNVARRRQRLLPAYTQLFIRYPQLPSRLFRWLPQSILKQQLGQPVPLGCLLGYVLEKQWRRQEFDYYHPDMRYAHRKHVGKPSEALLEAYTLAQIGIRPN